MNKFDVFIDVQDKRWIKEIASLKDLVKKCKDFAVEEVLSDVAFLNKNKNFNINLALSDDKTVHLLNKQFRNMDKPTNVLSFANADDEFFEQTLEQEQDVELGDVIVAFETMKREAEEQGVSLRDHFCHLWVHGILHVLGYDHIETKDRIEMESKEIKILSKLNIENPYQE